MTDAVRGAALFDLSHTVLGDILSEYAFPWEILPHIGTLIREVGATLPAERYTQPREDVWIAKSAKVASTASIHGPCIIGEETEVRHCAFIRGNALVGRGTVIGNSTELKNVILFDEAQVPHFNYVGDSILGYRAHLGAGAITSNVKSDKSPVWVRVGKESAQTGLKKLGAMIGDRAEIGCGCVLAPGAVIGRDAVVYPLSFVRGSVPAGTIFKTPDNIVKKRNI